MVVCVVVPLSPHTASSSVVQMDSTCDVNIGSVKAAGEHATYMSMYTVSDCSVLFDASSIVDIASAYKLHLLHSTSSFTNRIALFEGINVGLLTA